LYRRPLLTTATRAGLAWSSDGWAQHALSAYPGCRSAAAILPSGLCLFRIRGHAHPYVVQTEPKDEGDGRVTLPDPAAAASAVHVWLLSEGTRPPSPVRLTCHIGQRDFHVLLRPATGEETTQLF
jgi:hypothetical protein